METIALFGGSFDPPHLGHETIVKKALQLNTIDKVVVMPTYINPFKDSSHASAETRFKWLKNIFSPYKNVIIDSFEVDLKRKVPSIESVLYLLKKYKKIHLIIGADNVASLHKWKDYQELKNLVEFVVVTRDKLHIPKEFVTIKINEDISSTQLREQINTKKLSTVCADEIMNFYKETH